MQDKTKQAVDEFLNSKPSLDSCVVVWEQLAVEVQNGDQDLAIEQARRIATLTKTLLTIHGDDPAVHIVSDLACAFVPALKERGRWRIPDAGQD